MRKGAEFDQISGERQQRTKKLPVNSDTDRRQLLPGPFAVTDGDRRISEHELSKPLPRTKII